MELTRSEKMKLAWIKRKERYGNTGAKNPENFKLKQQINAKNNYKNGNLKLKEYFKRMKENPTLEYLSGIEKISKKLTGRKLTKEHSKKIADAQRGQKRKSWGHHTKETKKKMSKSISSVLQQKIKKEGFHWGHVGIEHTEESKEKIRQANWGEKSNLYIDGRSYEKYPVEFRLIKPKILKRDNYKCIKCTKENQLIVHHIDENTKNNKEQNLITLCISCHMSFHHPSNVKLKEKRINYFKSWTEV